MNTISISTFNPVPDGFFFHSQFQKLFTSPQLYSIPNNTSNIVINLILVIASNERVRIGTNEMITPCTSPFLFHNLVMNKLFGYCNLDVGIVVFGFIDTS